MRSAIILLFLLASVSTAAAQHPSKYFAPDFPGKVYEHNDSTMDMKLHRGIVEISYIFPRAGLPETVEMGTVLFEGSFDPVFDERGDFVRFTLHVTGTAYIFSSRCGEIPYDVSGWFEPDLSTLVLSGLAPVLDQRTCEVLGYTMDSRNATLIFRRDMRPIVE